jgi:3-oxoacyl-[acyl-carrier-protein] synthase-1
VTGTDIVIAGIGMMTSVGLSAAETSASVRAATMRFVEMPWFDRKAQPFRVAEILEEGLPELASELYGDRSLSHREARMLRIGTMPLRHAMTNLPRNERPALSLALPDRETARPLDRPRFLARFHRQAGGAFDAAISSVEFRGRAGGVQAMAWASDLLRSGRKAFVLAGGIECYRDPYILGMLDAEERVKSESAMDGFVPAEAAGFLLLATRQAADLAGLAAVASLSRVALGFEEGHLYSREAYRGNGLAATLQKLFAEAGAPAPIGEVFSSMNGENHWAKEWGVSYLRNRDHFTEDVRMQHPADCLGDSGAAAGPVLAGLAALGQLKRFRRSPALVYCSSDSGDRAAVAVIAERN